MSLARNPEGQKEEAVTQVSWSETSLLGFIAQVSLEKQKPLVPQSLMYYYWVSPHSIVLDAKISVKHENGCNKYTETSSCSATALEQELSRVKIAINIDWPEHLIWVRNCAR